MAGFASGKTSRVTCCGYPKLVRIESIHNTEWAVWRATPDHIRAVVGFLEYTGCEKLTSGARNGGARSGLAPFQPNQPCLEFKARTEDDGSHTRTIPAQAENLAVGA